MITRQRVAGIALSTFSENLWLRFLMVWVNAQGIETPGRFKKSDHSGSWSSQVIYAVLQRQRKKEGRLPSWSKGYISHAGKPSCKSPTYVPIAWSWSWRGRRKSPVRREVRRTEARIPKTRGAAEDTRDNPANMSVRHDLFRTLRDLECISPKCLSAGSNELSRRLSSPSPPVASGIPPFASSNVRSGLSAGVSFPYFLKTYVLLRPIFTGPKHKSTSRLIDLWDKWIFKQIR